ncbi:DUF1289 domain-containing protein [Rhizobacter sp. OV335]|jgi:predicted Fe-S protein YdhL (DUF1289 family)|uniref:DUF1289 domain-containing protein n=1 Tax=Rhizobacter sp. OV335 TaxID=1500264 RepID=UPI00092136AA|nr:DUF1289 domain-containing protein [Rhizobacter sp. OV335]SHM29028.1 hypothetical protein SAMN02787076_00981 [Rhizobacter sp. OV335]
MDEAAAVPSPCVNICRMDAASGLCVGCWRTIDEIAAWSKMDDNGKRQVWQVIALRRADAPVVDGERSR